MLVASIRSEAMAYLTNSIAAGASSLLPQTETILLPISTDDVSSWPLSPPALIDTDVDRQTSPNEPSLPSDGNSISTSQIGEMPPDDGLSSSFNPDEVDRSSRKAHIRKTKAFLRHVSAKAGIRSGSQVYPPKDEDASISVRGNHSPAGGPIFIVSILPQTTLPAHIFQAQVPPLSPHHYPAISPLWPLLSPPIALHIRNLYLRRYTRDDVNNLNCYLPVKYRRPAEALQRVGRELAVHPSIAKLWKDVNEEPGTYETRQREQSFDSCDGSTFLSFESSLNNLIGSYYGLPTSGIIESVDINDCNSLSSSSDTASVKEPTGSTLSGSGNVGGVDESPLNSSNSIQHRLAYHLLVSSSVLNGLTQEEVYGTVVCFGYFGECSCEWLPDVHEEKVRPHWPHDVATPGTRTTREHHSESSVTDGYRIEAITSAAAAMARNVHVASDEKSELTEPECLVNRSKKTIPCDTVSLSSTWTSEVECDVEIEVLEASSLSSNLSVAQIMFVEHLQPGTAEESPSDDQRPTGVEAGADLLEGGAGEPTEAETAALPVIRKKEREYSGMLEYDKRDEGAIIKMLIYDLKPRVAVTLLPGLPAYILFMCIRHTDHINDDEKVRSLLNHTVTGIKRVIKKRHQDLDSTVLWLSNTLRLLHNLKQYSGDKAFQQENSPKQSEQSLKNFDLSEYRQVLSDIAVWIYNGVIKLMEESIQPLVVPSILEHEAIAGLSGNKPGGMKGRKGSAARELESPVEPQKALDMLLAELTLFYRTLAMFGTDPELITQVFRQIFYFICAGALNNLLLRKDMCHWSKGMQIRYNLSHLEQWTRDMRLPELGNTDALSPIIQAAQLLQARKTDDDVDSICDLCDKLSVPQIVKILNLYTPDDFEERVPASFIQKIQQRLLERPNAEHEQATLIMNTKFSFPVRFPFNPSSIRLEDIELAEVLNLTMLRKV